MENNTAIFNYNNTCNYLSFEHACKKGAVQFISSGCGSTDYCVSGKRVRVMDDGSCDASPEHKRMVALYLTAKYASYCEWHVGFKAKNASDNYVPQLLAFDSIMPQGWNA